MDIKTNGQQGRRLMTLEIEEMLKLQEGINHRVHPDWRSQNYPWYRATWTECAELLDQFGWKWWKQQDTDWEQVQLELIDIWHFGLSDILQRAEKDMDSKSLFTLANSIAQSYLDHPTSQDSTAEQFRDAIESFATITLTTKQFSLVPFYHLMHLANLPMQVLYVQYVGKNALNHFRQVNGYQQGSYQKSWHGREDNEHLSEIINELTQQGTSIANLYDTVYQALDNRYPCNETPS